MQEQASKPYQALASLSLGLSAGAILAAGFSAGFYPALSGILVGSPLAAAARQIHRKEHLTIGDYSSAGATLRLALSDGYKEDIKPCLPPQVQSYWDEPALLESSETDVDWAFLLNHSAIITAPTETGKSWFCSYLMQRQTELNNGLLATYICSKDTWKRGHTWAGLKNCPDWLKRRYMALGRKYAGKYDRVEAIHKETDDAVDLLYKELNRRVGLVADEKQTAFPTVLLLIDEFPVYWARLTRLKDTDRMQRIQEILVSGQGNSVILHVVSQDDAVGMIGLNQAQQKQMLTVELFPPGKVDNYPNAQIKEQLNAMPGRKAVITKGREFAVTSLPILKSEPMVDWSHMIQSGEFQNFCEAIATQLTEWKFVEELSLTKAWTRLLTLEGCPTVSDRQSTEDNKAYRHFKQIYGALKND